MHVRNYAVALYLVPRQAPAGRALRRLTDRFSLFGCGERKRAVIDLFARDFRLLTGEARKSVNACAAEYDHQFASL
jgi:hypothetical protein